MKLNINSLAQHLKKQLSPIYLISSNEFLLRDEACQQIRHVAYQNGFSECEIWDVDKQAFPWEKLYQDVRNLSLFNEKTILEIRITGNKISANGKKALQAYADNPMKNKLLLISIAKLDAQQQKTNWFRKIEKSSVFILIWPLTWQQLPGWISKRLKQKNITIDKQGLTFLAEHVEGNLLAAKQEVDRLSLVYDQGYHLTLNDILKSTCVNSNYSVFDLSDCFLNGDKKRTLRIFNQLKAKCMEPTLILWAIVKELRVLIDVKMQMQSGETMPQALNEQRVWEKRKPLFVNCLKRHDLKGLMSLLISASKIDKMIKGIDNSDVWANLLELVLSVAI